MKDKVLKEFIVKYRLPFMSKFDGEYSAKVTIREKDLGKLPTFTRLVRVTMLLEEEFIGRIVGFDWAEFTMKRDFIKGKHKLSEAVLEHYCKGRLDATIEKSLKETLRKEGDV